MGFILPLPEPSSPPARGVSWQLYFAWDEVRCDERIWIGRNLVFTVAPVCTPCFRQTDLAAVPPARRLIEGRAANHGIRATSLPIPEVLRSTKTSRTKFTDETPICKFMQERTTRSVLAGCGLIRQLIRSSLCLSSTLIIAHLYSLKQIN